MIVMRHEPEVMGRPFCADFSMRWANSSPASITMDAKIPLDLPEIVPHVPQARPIGRLAANLPAEASPIEPVYIREPYITKAKPKVSG